jgi:phage-related protein
MKHDPDSPRTRTVTLPSGKTVVVNYVDEQLAAHVADPEHQLEICGACASQLVHPVRWQEAGSRHWEIELRCPECEWQGTGVFDQLAVERFDETLEQATDDLVSDLKTIERANMADFADRFVAALHAGHILPEDF